VKTVATTLVLLFSSLSLTAQNSAKPEDQVLVLRPQPVGSGCPISLVASQGVWDHTMRVRQGQQEKVIQPFGQRIFLTLNDSHPASIVAATVKVYGLTGKNHMMQTNGNASANGEATRIIEVPFATGQKGGVTGDLYIPGFTAVNSIELIQVSYDDGRVWRVGGSSVCRVTPDPVMLIANH
jgi:hypothetical protein